MSKDLKQVKLEKFHGNLFTKFNEKLYWKMWEASFFILSQQLFMGNGWLIKQQLEQELENE